MASVPHASKCSNYSLRSQRDLKELKKRIQECGMDNFQRTQSKIENLFFLLHKQFNTCNLSQLANKIAKHYNLQIDRVTKRYKDVWISWICKHDKEFQMMLSEIISDGTHDPQNMDFPLQPLEEESDPNSPYYDGFTYI